MATTHSSRHVDISMLDEALTMAVRGEGCDDGLFLACRDLDAELLGAEDLHDVGLIQLLGCF